MNLTDINTARFPSSLLAVLRDSYPRQAQLDYGEVFGTATTRAARLWREQLVPEFGPDKAAAFEKALWRVRMLAETSIPWPMGFGYAFGAACHAQAGGAGAQRDEAATNSALAMFLIGLFDHLFDKFPHEFGGIADLMSKEALRRYTLERDLSALVYDPSQVLASGWVDLYRLYFTRCHRLLGPDPDSALARHWHAALVQMHDAEWASRDRRISTLAPTEALIDQSESPGTTSSWVVALSACLGLDETAVKTMQPFARDLTQLSRLVDSVVDVDDDIRQDLWGGLAVRLALDASDQASADRIVMDMAEECARLLQGLANGPAAQLLWQAGDRFSLMDVFWAYLWSWAGGETPGWKPAGVPGSQAAVLPPV